MFCLHGTMAGILKNERGKNMADRRIKWQSMVSSKKAAPSYEKWTEAAEGLIKHPD